MSNNCLVTKLKGTVSNPNLDGMGWMRIVSDASEKDRTKHVYISCNADVDLQLLGGGTIKNTEDTDLGTSTQILANTSADLYFQGTLIIKNKYAVTVLTATTGYSTDFNKYMPYMESLSEFDFNVNNSLSSLSAFNNDSSLIYFRLVGTDDYRNMPGDVENLPSSIKNLTLAGTNTTLNVENLSHIVGLENLYLYGLYVTATGDMRNLMNSLHANGRVSGRLHYECNTPIINVDGSTSAGSFTVEFSAGGWSIVS